jgi:hypothetical protein
MMPGKNNKAGSIGATVWGIIIISPSAIRKADAAMMKG